MRTRYIYTPHFSGDPLPFLCRVETTRLEEWEKSNTPRISENRMSYDAFGNLLQLSQIGDTADPLDDRTVEFLFLPNLQEFIINRPSTYRLLGFDDKERWTELNRTFYEYDNSLDHNLSPGNLGELTRIRRWNHQDRRFADTSFQYDGWGNIREVTGPSIPSNANGVVVRIEYDCEYNRFPEKRCNSLFCTISEWNKREGLLSKMSNANGNSTSYEFDALGRQKAILYPDGGFDRWIWPSTLEWGTKWQKVIHEHSDNSRDDGVFREMTFFDGLGRALRIEREGDITEEISGYDGTSSRITARNLPHFTANPASTVHYEYDPMGRLTKILHPDNTTRTTRYNVGVRTVRDELQALTYESFDPFGRITSVQENLRNCPDESCPIVDSGLTTYRYDARDLLTRIVDPKGNQTVWSWDSLGRPSRICDPDRGCTVYSWNDDGTEESETNAKGTTIRKFYDNLGRRIERQSFDKSSVPVRSIRWIWDHDKNSHRLRGASLNRVTHIEDTSPEADLFYSYHYDKLDRVDLSQKCVDKKCVEFLEEFDLAGRIKRLTYPDYKGIVSKASMYVDYIYDDSGELVSIPGYVNEFRRDSAGRITYLQFANGVEEVWTTDPHRGWINGIDVVVKSSPIFSQRLLHDKAGRVWQETVAISGVSNVNTYRHDDLGRLTDVFSSDASRNQHFDFDILGNITNDSKLGRIDYADPKHVHAVTHIGRVPHYGYDEIGQMVSSDTLTLTWNTENRPTAIDQKNGATNRFAYDFTGRRVKSTTAGSTRIDPDSLVEIDSNGKMMFWVIAEGRRLALREPGTPPQFIHSDSLGSTRLMTNLSGAVINKYDYSIWGNEKLLAGSNVMGLHFAGSWFDNGTNLNYMNARYYNSILGRFISADTLIPTLYSPQSLNRYAYALNDPVTLTDPSGHCVVVRNEMGEAVELDCTYEPNRSPLKPHETDNKTSNEAKGDTKESSRSTNSRLGELTESSKRPDAVHPKTQPNLPSFVSIIITRDISIGTHAALLLERPHKSILYDPAGSYQDIVPADSLQRSKVYDKYASYKRFKKFHNSFGTSVERYQFYLSSSDADIVEARLEGLGEYENTPLGDSGPGSCAIMVCAAITGTDKFGDVFFVLPGSLADHMNKLQNKDLAIPGAINFGTMLIGPPLF